MGYSLIGAPWGTMNSTFIVEYLMRPFSPRKDYMLSSKRGLRPCAELPTVGPEPHRHPARDGWREERG